MLTYVEYTDILLNAYKFNSKQQEVLGKKTELLRSIYEYQNLVPETILFFGFSPWILSHKSADVVVTCISQEAVDFLKDSGKRVTVIETKDLAQYSKKFQCVVAPDEFFTFAKTEQEQLEHIRLICSLASEFIITTLRDYKNQDYKDKEFSTPMIVKHTQGNKVFLENHNYDLNDRNSWTSVVYEITNNQLQVHGPFNRRQMFFKQLAKFSADSGASYFHVQKNIMYKSLIKKNYEHIILIGMDSYEDQ